MLISVSFTMDLLTLIGSRCLKGTVLFGDHRCSHEFLFTCEAPLVWGDHMHDNEMTCVCRCKPGGNTRYRAYDRMSLTRAGYTPPNPKLETSKPLSQSPDQRGSFYGPRTDQFPTFPTNVMRPVEPTCSHA